MVMYADGTTLYCNLSNNANENYLNSELNKISEWLASNKLSLNTRKTKFMVFHTVQRKIQYPILTINNTVIERVKQFNFLGIILHYTLKWQKHIDHVSKQDAREAMRVVFSVLTKRICMHKTTFVRINSNIVLKVILNCMNMQIATQLIMMYNL